MSINPYITAHLEQMRLKDLLIRHASYMLILGLAKSEETVNDSVYDSVSIYCNQNHIEFKVNLFTSGVYEDSEFVTKLPAYHLYYKEEYEATFYPEDSLDTVLLRFFDSLKPKKQKWRWFSLPTFTIKRKVKVLGHTDY